ncbi:hypothetical protein N7539_007677 [Penicillium diatomitis]|uniref:Uncharacterized protein n=1 Tax=Penicillium diatomitis TaxID=2819901 RepID=A0A9X0BP82_9EURO|nr:uncharacterized protein N7539_007677 [Penicillium diatomitis]KAJ5477533.1 hypothetical protein N7539_007677 [Penicillium diatomitis]
MTFAASVTIERGSCSRGRSRPLQTPALVEVPAPYEEKRDGGSFVLSARAKYKRTMRRDSESTHTSHRVLFRRRVMFDQ